MPLATTIHRTKLYLARRKLLKRYKRYSAIADSYSCGLTLALHISPSLRVARDQLNEAIEDTKKLDPECKISLV